MKVHTFGRGILYCAAILSLSVLASCARIGATSRVDPPTVAVYPGGADDRPADTGWDPDKTDGRCQLLRGIGGWTRGAIDLDCFKFLEDKDKDGAENLAYSQAAQNPEKRNRLTALLLKHSDDVCVREMGQLTANQATVNASLNTLATAVTTAANIVTGEQAKSILTGIGTFAGATRSHMNADVYRNTVSYAISRAVTLERRRLREGIEARYGQALGAFTVDDAIRAANEYHGVCSFYKGLELVLASVEGDQRTRDREARRAQIEDLQERIRDYHDQQLRAPSGSGEKATYDTLIQELQQRIQQLVLASVPSQTAPGKIEPATGGTNDQDVDGVLAGQAAAAAGGTP